MSGPATAGGIGEPARRDPQGSGEANPEGAEQSSEGAGHGPVIRDRRRLDPQTGRVREAYAGAPGPGPDTGSSAAGAAGPAESGGSTATQSDEQSGEPSGDQLDPLAAALGLAEERLADLQRLQAEFLNYKRRVERDRDLARVQAVAGVLEALLPVLDDIHAARQHGDLEGGPFASIADKLEATLARFGLIRYGEPGELFDPTVHEALLHTEAELAEGTPDTTVVQVLQPGYRTGDKVLRAARVAVADPR